MLPQLILDMERARYMRWTSPSQPRRMSTFLRFVRVDLHSRGQTLTLCDVGKLFVEDTPLADYMNALLGRCGSAPQIAHAINESLSACGGSTASGDTCTFSCLEGYVASARLTCTNASWDTQTCVTPVQTSGISMTTDTEHPFCIINCLRSSGYFPEDQRHGRIIHSNIGRQ